MEEYIPKSKVLELWRYWKYIEAYDQTKAMKGIGIDRLDDGTLSVEVEDATKVKRVLVEDGKYGDLYYADGRPQGEWIWHEDEDICNCSRCNFEIDAEGCIEPMEYVGVFRYCPYCGAKMKGADDE